MEACCAAAAQLCSASSAPLDSWTAAASNSGVIGAIEPLKRVDSAATRSCVQTSSHSVPEQSCSYTILGAEPNGANRSRGMRPAPREEPSAINKTRAAQKAAGALHAKRTGARPPTPVALPDEARGAADAAPRAAGVPRDRAEDRDTRPW